MFSGQISAATSAHTTVTPPPALASHQYTHSHALATAPHFFCQHVRVRRRMDCTSGAPRATKAATPFECQHVRKNAESVRTVPAVSHAGWGVEGSRSLMPLMH